MKTAFLLIAASAATAAFAMPAAAQVPDQYPYPQHPYGQPVPQPYPGQPGYAYGQGYGQQANPLGQIIDSLLGNRYAVNDRTAVTQCASAVMADAGRRYGGNGQYGQYGQQYGQQYAQAYGQYGQQGYPGYSNRMRVTAITEVQRRKNGLRVRGLIDSGMNRYGGGYGGGYGQQGYGNGGGYGMADLKFRCTVDYRGAVTDIRIDRNDDNRRR